MSKGKSRKEIEETIRNKVARSYNGVIDHQKEVIHSLYHKVETAQEARKRAEARVEELEEKVQQCEDWIERLQDFVNMPADLRNQKFSEMRKKRDFETQFSNLQEMLNFFVPPFSLR